MTGRSTAEHPGSADVVRALLRARTTLLADADRDPGARERLLVRSDMPGTMQLYELSAGELVQLTALSEPVTTAHYLPGARRAVLAVDQGGNELHQLYVLDLDEAAREPVRSFERLHAITADPRFAHQLAAVAPDGRWIAYLSNRANGVDFDVWRWDVATEDHRLLHASGAYCHPASGCSPDGRYVSVLRPGEEPLDVELMLVDADTGEVLPPLAHPDEAALVGEPAWLDSASFCVSSNVGRDFSAIVRHDLADATTTPLTGTGERFDADVVSSADGATVVVIENQDGASVMSRYDQAAGAAGP